MKLSRDVSGSEAARALQRLGFVIQRQTGSHLILRRESRTVVVPRHKPLKPGTLKGIIEQAGLKLEQFVEELWSRCGPCRSISPPAPVTNTSAMKPPEWPLNQTTRKLRAIETIWEDLARNEWRFDQLKAREQRGSP